MNSLRPLFLAGFAVFDRAAFLLAMGVAVSVWGADSRPWPAIGTTGTKQEQTSCFWQQDPEAGFPGDGSDYCAPTAISDGLIYLAQARGLAALVSGTQHSDQIGLIKELGVDMNTNPQMGTNPDKIVTGLRRYVDGKGLRFGRLEVTGWRKLSSVNRACFQGTQPNLEKLRAAATDPNCVEVFNVGWYRAEANGYSRHGGHWVIAVGAGAAAGNFSIHNPLLRPELQKAKTAVTLTLLDSDFPVTDGAGGEISNLKGYYKVAGAGLPFGGKTVAAILDSVIVFSVQE